MVQRVSLNNDDDDDDDDDDDGEDTIEDVRQAFQNAKAGVDREVAARRRQQQGEQNSRIDSIPVLTTARACNATAATDRRPEEERPW